MRNYVRVSKQNYVISVTTYVIGLPSSPGGPTRRYRTLQRVACYKMAPIGEEECAT